jgi:nucleotide-binding universal stress UspA family protein
MFKKILFFSDFSENSHLAFTCALNLANTYHAKLLILHVTSGSAYQEQLFCYIPPEKLDEREASLKEKINRELSVHYLQKIGEFKNFEVILEKGVALYKIIEIIEKESVDLIVMGDHRTKGKDHVIFDSTVEKVVKKSPCSVLIVRLP